MGFVHKKVWLMLGTLVSLKICQALRGPTRGVVNSVYPRFIDSRTFCNLNYF